MIFLIAGGKKAFAGYLEDKNELFNSSSGGAFTSIAKSVLSENGYVCGAVYSDDFKSVFHVYSNKIDVVKKMRGSKYVQSDKPQGFYDGIRKLIESGELVLFTGVPCEAAALKKYVGKDCNNLVICDLICHGVTSPIVLKEYVEYLESKYSSKIIEFSMRYKNEGLVKPFLRAIFENGKVFCKPFYSTPIGFAFSNIALRPCCYNCIFKGNNRDSDITIGDFWGIDSTYACYNKMGVSLIIANTERGLAITNSLQGFKLYDVDYEFAAKNNPCLSFPVRSNENREKYFDLLHKKGLMYATRKLNKPKTLRECVSKYVPYFIKSFIKSLIIKG